MDRSYPHPPTVLIVDDDADMRLYVRGCLRTLGLSDVMEAANGADALQLAETLQFDLIITDVFMPCLDGYTLCKSLKAQEAHSAIPVLLISGETDAASVRSSGADGFLAKPFNATSLEMSISRLLP